MSEDTETLTPEQIAEDAAVSAPSNWIEAMAAWCVVMGVPEANQGAQIGFAAGWSYGYRARPSQPIQEERVDPARLDALALLLDPSFDTRQQRLSDPRGYASMYDTEEDEAFERRRNRIRQKAREVIEFINPSRETT